MSHAAHLANLDKPVREGFVRRPSDWSAGARISIVNHAPSHMTFGVSLPGACGCAAPGLS